MELENSPHPQGGISTADAKRLMATAIAQQTGKTVEEVLSFLSETGTELAAKTPTPKLDELPKELQDAKLPLPVTPDLVVDSQAKNKAPARDDGFVVTETVDLEDASEADLNKLAEQEEEQDFSGKIRMGSKVKITWHRDQGVKGRLQFVGKIGTVVQATSKDGVTIYLVEFSGRKIPKLKLDKKSGKLLKGYELKKMQLMVDDSQVEAA